VPIHSKVIREEIKTDNITEGTAKYRENWESQKMKMNAHSTRSL
jgi:hypothetical protein